MKYSSNLVIIEAVQWIKDGDHASVVPMSATELLTCGMCGQYDTDHGWLQTSWGGHEICPKDWIITNTTGDVYPCKPDTFKKNYKPLNT